MVKCTWYGNTPPTYELRKPGDMWYNTNMIEGGHAQYYLDSYLSIEYKTTWLGKRPPIQVILPNGDMFCVDSQARDSKPHGWVVVGEPPLITCTPSIHVLEDDPTSTTSPKAERTRWHGFLTNGELT